MKKSFLSVLTMLAFVATTTIATSCSDKNKEEGGNAQSDLKHVPDTAKMNHEGFTPTTNIRYIDIDSIARAYTYAKSEMAKLDQKSYELQQYQNNLGAQVQKKANEVQQKIQNNGYLSQQSYEADMQELQTMQNNAERNYAQRAQTLSNEMAEFQETVFKAIENYVIKYNKEKKYDAILLKAAGIYFNPELDITDDIIKGLNEESPVSATPATDKVENEAKASK